MTTELPDVKDKALWKLAKKRAGFKRHLVNYVIVNAFLWAIWYFTGHKTNDGDFFPWPLWATLGWGIGIGFHYAGAYLYKGDDVDKEYQKLKNKQS
jgi:hypothetical protein